MPTERNGALKEEEAITPSPLLTKETRQNRFIELRCYQKGALQEEEALCNEAA